MRHANHLLNVCERECYFGTQHFDPNSLFHTDILPSAKKEVAEDIKIDKLMMNEITITGGC